MRQTTLLLMLLPASALLLSATRSDAGATEAVPVVVDSEGMARGSVGATRDSANSETFIQCSVDTNDPELGGLVGRCSARGQVGTLPGDTAFWSCVTKDRSMIEAISAIGAHSRIEFRTETPILDTALDNPDECSWLYIRTDSRYEPARR